MKIIHEIEIEKEKAKLLLLDDNKTIQVMLGNKVISTSEGVWNNIKDEEWAQHALLSIQAEGYVKKSDSRNRLKLIAEEAFK